MTQGDWQLTLCSIRYSLAFRLCASESLCVVNNLHQLHLGLLHGLQKPSVTHQSERLFNILLVFWDFLLIMFDQGLHHLQ